MNLDDKIKEKLKQDQFISEKAEDIFNNFSPEIIETNEKTTNINKIAIKYKIGRFIAAVTCLIGIIGGANVYASTHGYGNVFFLIKYIVTGEKAEITDKNELLSDRDITISYEPIYLTENLKLQIRNLQIKNNQEILNLEIKEKKNTYLTPLKYKIINSKEKILCEYNSLNGGKEGEYAEEIIFNGLTKKDESIKLEIFTSYNTKLAEISINLNTKEVIVQGEEEALDKVSEIELKKYLEKELIKKIKPQNNDEKVVLNINKLSYCAGLYTAEINYTLVDSKKSFEIDYTKLKTTDATVYFKLNGNLFELVKYEEV